MTKMTNEKWKKKLGRKREKERERRAQIDLSGSSQKTTHIRQFSYVRFIGLFLVLIYHFYPKVLPGGFIGVDVFFTFSGYLITGGKL